MMLKFSSAIGHVRRMAKSVRRDEAVLINQGRILSRLNEDKTFADISNAEFKVFSQFGEDGIIQYLTSHLEIESKNFIEFGVENFEEANCRFLLMKDLWSGFVIDGSADNIKSLKESYYYWQYPLHAACAFVDKDSVADLLDQGGFGRSPGILSIDIDGVDYHVLKALSAWSPEILIVEYNSNFGKERPVSVPYVSTFARAEAHWSNQYWGANLPAFVHLANERDMALVGVTSTGQNAFFVQRHLLNEYVRERSVADCHRVMSFRDSRNQSGELTFLEAEDRAAIIAHLPLVDVATGCELTVGDL